MGRPLVAFEPYDASARVFAEPRREVLILAHCTNREADSFALIACMWKLAVPQNTMAEQHGCFVE